HERPDESRARSDSALMSHRATSIASEPPTLYDEGRPSPAQRGATTMANEDEDENLTDGQKLILDQLRHLGGPIEAEGFAYASFGVDIDELGDEELQTIPDFLLDPWLKAQEREGKL